jgi:hypothetical protein
LQIQSNPYAVDEHDALIQQLLVCDFCVKEFVKGLARTDELAKEIGRSCHFFWLADAPWRGRGISGTGTVRTCPPFPVRSNMAQ